MLEADYDADDLAETARLVSNLHSYSAGALSGALMVPLRILAEGHSGPAGELAGSLTESLLDLRREIELLVAPLDRVLRDTRPGLPSQTGLPDALRREMITQALGAAAESLHGKAMSLCVDVQEEAHVLRQVLWRDMEKTCPE